MPCIVCDTGRLMGHFDPRHTPLRAQLSRRSLFCRMYHLPSLLLCSNMGVSKSLRPQSTEKHNSFRLFISPVPSRRNPALNRLTILVLRPKFEFLAMRSSWVHVNEGHLSHQGQGHTILSYTSILSTTATYPDKHQEDLGYGGPRVADPGAYQGGGPREANVVANQKASLYILFVGGLPSIERQSRFSCKHEK